MSTRIQLSPALPGAFKELRAADQTVAKAAADAGLDQGLLELVRIRASQLNGCAFCLDAHARDAREAGESDRRIVMLAAWWETKLYTEQERAALALTDAMTRLAQTQDVPDEVYEQATAVFTEQQYAAIAWAIALINTLNRLGVTSRKDLPEAGW
ncbi:carboxymuconolactone decarboxylase family protein [Amycolatopsis aidingensis]|uniref:carboxymuconolactone decarboxylase family protein n=1 Tax=Amycolatopsis aidingensis TaxID=2842453 RepID=UPI001C0E1BAA|nr:carboxymuconolactone decarboxylase family protein [Amycolatopsis aidingensis]